MHAKCRMTYGNLAKEEIALILGLYMFVEPSLKTAEATSAKYRIDLKT